MVKIGNEARGFTGFRFLIGSAAVIRGLRSLSVVLALLPVLAFAADKAKVIATVERPQVGVGESFVLTVSVQSSESVNPDEPVIPALDGLRVLNMSTSSSTSSQMSAGAGGWKIETTRRIDFNYVMVALRKGTLIVPPFSVKVEDELVKTKPITLTASEGRPGGQPSAGAGGGVAGSEEEDLTDDPEALFRQLLARRMGTPPAHNDLPTNPNEVLFIQTEVDKKEVYEGEQITVNWYILVRGNLLSLDRTKFPDLKGFWKEIIEEVPALQFGQEVINGQVYRKALLASHALFPIKAGTATIDEYKIKGRVQVPSAVFGFGQDYAFTRASDRVPIKVLPLPLEGRPKDFTGAVGLFTVSANLDSNVVTANQPTTIKIRFEGAGNAKVIELPPIEWPAGLEVVETKTDSRYFKNGQSFKEFDVLVVPRQTGDLTVPAISVSLFDPNQKKYYSKTIDPISMKVVGGSGAAVLPSARIGGEAGGSGSAAGGAGGKVGPSLPQPLAELDSSRAMQGLFSWPLVALMYLGAFIWLGIRAFRVFSGQAQQKDLYKALVRRTRKAEEAAKAGDFRAVGVNMINLYAEILGELSGQGGSHKEISKMLDMGPPSLRRDFGEDIQKTLAGFESLSFAPIEMLGAFKTAAPLNEKVEEGRKLLKKILDSSPRASAEG